MTEKLAKPHNVGWVLPCITVADGQRAIDFYQNAFGFSVAEVVKDAAGHITHVELRYKDALLMLSPEGAYGATARAPVTTETESPISLYLYCDDIDQFFNQAQQAGAKVIMQPEDMFWGDRMCKLQDPDGYHWAFATHLPK